MTRSRRSTPITKTLRILSQPSVLSHPPRGRVAACREHHAGSFGSTPLRKRAPWRRSVIQTSARSISSRRAATSRRWSSNWLRDRRRRTPAVRPRIWLRAAASFSASPVPGMENATALFWSPEGGSLAFFADRKLKRIDLPNGAVVPLADVTASFVVHGTWGRGGVILFSTGPFLPDGQRSARRLTVPSLTTRTAIWLSSSGPISAPTRPARLATRPITNPSRSAFRRTAASC